MGRARMVLEWDQTAGILCLIANANRDARKHPAPFRVEDFHPFRKKSAGGIRITRKNIRLLKAAFVDPNKGRRQR